MGEELPGAPDPAGVFPFPFCEPGRWLSGRLQDAESRRLSSSMGTDPSFMTACEDLLFRQRVREEERKNCFSTNRPETVSCPCTILNSVFGQ